MAKTVIYWMTTVLIAAAGIMAGLTYLSGAQPAVEGFARLGYPQPLRILLGLAKPLGAIALLIPGWPRLKAWAYAGFTFAWIGGGPGALSGARNTGCNHGVRAIGNPDCLLFTRPESRQVPTRAVAYL